MSSCFLFRPETCSLDPTSALAPSVAGAGVLLPSSSGDMLQLKGTDHAGSFPSHGSDRAQRTSSGDALTTSRVPPILPLPSAAVPPKATSASKPVNPLACDRCPHIAHSTRSLKEHVANHDGNKPFVACRECERMYPSFEAFHQHKLDKHP